MRRSLDCERQEWPSGASVVPFAADMHGWPEIAAAVAAVVATLPPAELANACVAGRNRGEAAVGPPQRRGMAAKRFI